MTTLVESYDEGIRRGIRIAIAVIKDGRQRERTVSELIEEIEAAGRKLETLNTASTKENVHAKLPVR